MASSNAVDPVVDAKNDRLVAISQSGGVKSISDDDLCATCSGCDYRPGEMSGCALSWPGLENEDGYVQKCTGFVPLNAGERICQ